jgi:hypothetical protein
MALGGQSGYRAGMVDVLNAAVEDAMTRRYEVFTRDITARDVVQAYLDRTVLCAELERICGGTMRIDALTGEEKRRRASDGLLAGLLEEIVLLRQRNTELEVGAEVKVRVGSGAGVG